MPATNGASGPTMVNPMRCCCANRSSAGISSAAMGTFSTLLSAAVPALPGATYTRPTRADCAAFHASACSRPPPPTIKTFMFAGQDKTRRKASCAMTAQWLFDGFSVAEVADAGEHHRHVMFIRRGDDFIVANRAARLDDGGDAGGGGGVDAVAEREEGLRGHDGAAHRKARVRGLHGGDPGADHAAHLPGADADGARVPRVHDGVGFDAADHAPGKEQIA